MVNGLSIKRTKKMRKQSTVSFAVNDYQHVWAIDFNGLFLDFSSLCKCRLLALHKSFNSDWLADQWDERSVLGHAQSYKGRLKGDDPEIDTAQTPKRFNGLLALLEKIGNTFTDSIPNKLLRFSHNLVTRRHWLPEPLLYSECLDRRNTSPNHLLTGTEYS